MGLSAVVELVDDGKRCCASQYVSVGHHGQCFVWGWSQAGPDTGKRFGGGDSPAEPGAMSWVSALAWCVVLDAVAKEVPRVIAVTVAAVPAITAMVRMRVGSFRRFMGC